MKVSKVLVSSDTWDMLCYLAELNGIVPQPAIEPKRPRVEETAMSHQETVLLGRLVEAYPDFVPMDQLVTYTCNNVVKGEVGDPIQAPLSQVCRIRARLGDDAIETVWPMRVNKKGKKVRVYRAQALGYRASAKLIDGLQEKKGDR